MLYLTILSIAMIT